MKYVDFESVNLRLSKIAFGCAGVMGRIGRAQALNAMQAAFDAGVTHFDVARSYGFGEAENVLGHFANGKRDRITIATKFGIAPPKHQRALQFIKPVIRGLTRHAKALKALVRSASTNALTPGAFDISSARGSFDKSLCALGLDYVDILFLHDCSPEDHLGDELLAWLEGLIKSGKIRTWGIATRREWIDTVSAAMPVKPRIVQCQGGVLFPAIPFATERVPAVLHSPFGGTAGMGAAYEKIKTACAVMQSDCGTHIVSSNLYPQLLLESAIHLSARNVVLCSMFDPKHIRLNVEAVERPLYTREQLETFINALHSTPQMSIKRLTSEQRIA